jgi:CO/xanthine dehydrogenase FAD-binding subunit
MSLTSVKEYFRPDSNEAVLQLLETYGEGALIVAGGSFIHGLDARDLLTGVEALIDIQNLELKQISSDLSGLSVGAMVTLAELQQAQQLQNSSAFAALLDALTYPPIQIRNVATLGGNIASACPYFDLPTATMALDGIVRAQGPQGSREIELQTFYAGMFENVLAGNEYVTGLVFPTLPPRSASAFIKFETNANDLAIVNVASRITIDESGSCQAARVVVGGGVAETPVRAHSAESLLLGKSMSEELIKQASAAVPSELQPMSDHRASAAYRSSLARTLTERTLRKAVCRLNQDR